MEDVFRKAIFVRKGRRRPIECAYSTIGKWMKKVCRDLEMWEVLLRDSHGHSRIRVLPNPLTIQSLLRARGIETIFTITTGRSTLR